MRAGSQDPVGLDDTWKAGKIATRRRMSAVPAGSPGPQLGLPGRQASAFDLGHSPALGSGRPGGVRAAGRSASMTSFDGPDAKPPRRSLLAAAFGTARTPGPSAAGEISAAAQASVEDAQPKPGTGV